MTLPEIITDWVNEHFENSNCFLVDVMVRANITKIQVLIDCDSGVDIDACAKLSRFLEQRLESQKLVPEKYLLEVSSPGVGSPFKKIRQYHKSINRPLNITLIDDSKIEGVLAEVSPNGITIIPPAPKKKPKKSTDINENSNITITILFEQIKEATEQIVF